MSKMSQEDMSELAKSLDMSMEEFQDIMKAAEEDVQDKPTKEGEEEDDDDDSEKEEKEGEDMEKSLKADIASKLAELRNLSKPKEDLNKSNGNDDLIKSFGKMKDDLIKAIGEYKEEVTVLKSENDDLKKSIGEMKETLEKIASNSQGTKGMRYTNNNVIEKSMDVEEKDGKTYFDSRDREGILKSMEEIMEKSKDDDLVKAIGDDIIQLNSTNSITQGAVRRLNKAGVYLKEQMEQ